MKKVSKNLKTSLNALVITALLILTICNETYAQQSDINQLCNMWHLETYIVNGKKYPPNKKERDDFILFTEDLNFTSKSESKQEEGTYILNTNGAYVLMIDKKGEELKAYIISITKNNLILKFDINEIRDVEFHYNSSI